MTVVLCLYEYALVTSVKINDDQAVPNTSEYLENQNWRTPEIINYTSDTDCTRRLRNSAISARK